jgi:hypothetical protein
MEEVGGGCIIEQLQKMGAGLFGFGQGYLQVVNAFPEASQSDFQFLNAVSVGGQQLEARSATARLPGETIPAVFAFPWLFSIG